MRRHSQLGRADLLRCWQHYQEAPLAHFAAALGYTPRPPRTTISSPSTRESPAPGMPTVPVTAPLSPPQEAPRARFYRVVAQQQWDQSEVIRSEPVWFQRARPYDYDLPAPTALTSRPAPPLLRWSRLWPFLKLVLGARWRTAAPDMPRIVDHLARVQPLQHLPRQWQQGWATQCQVLIDYGDPLRLFQADFNAVRRWLEQWHGVYGLTLLALPDGDPGGRCLRKTSLGWQDIGQYPVPPAGTPVLVLSDLGCGDTAEGRRRPWRRLGRRLRRAGCAPVALMPCPRRWWDEELTRLFTPVCWDRTVRLPRRLARRRTPTAAGQPAPREAAAEPLLRLLGAAIRVEPALLRAVRYLLPVQEADVGSEMAAWNHPQVHATGVAFYYDQQAIVAYQQAFADVDPSLRQQVARTIAAYHAHLSPVIPYEEQWVATQDAPGPLAVPAQDFGERLVKTLHTPHSVCGDTLSDWVHRLARWQPTQARMWRNDALAAAWTTIHLAQLRAGEVVHPPAGLDLARVSWLLAPSSTPRHYTLRQRGLELHIDQEEPPPAAPGLEAPGSLFTTLRATAPYIQVQQVEAEGAGSTAPWQALDRAIPLPAEGWCKLRTDQQELTIDSIVRPQWAESIGRDAYGLFVDVRLAGVVQRLRWIVPGEFTMGSPEDEAERFDVETPHQVILSQGFWLADTTCTQALWQAVMGENPSRFRGEDRPVDTVSWEKVQAFLTRCNAMAPELALRLPTEAEWEYACRAGTTTPFWFGEQITPEQVNYDGNYPYAGGKKGLYREETVPVKELPCNGWGLYQMHGNVWEWCQDRYAKYPAGPVIDPMGPGWGVRRVLRGGSWFSYGWNVRSAQRGAFGPGYRNDDAGFRLARGQVHRQVAPGAPGRSRGSRAGQTERSAVGQARRTRRGSRRKGTA